MDLMEPLLKPVKQVKLRRGEVSVNRSSELLALKFKDKRDVTMLSTIHNKEMVQGRRNAAHQKPKCISDYNKYMGVWIIQISCCSHMELQESL